MRHSYHLASISLFFPGFRSFVSSPWNIALLSLWASLPLNWWHLHSCHISHCGQSKPSEIQNWASHYLDKSFKLLPITFRVKTKYLSHYLFLQSHQSTLEFLTCSSLSGHLFLCCALSWNGLPLIQPAQTPAHLSRFNLRVTVLMKSFDPAVH